MAVKLPALPEYYAPDMDLSIVIDRGEVWYDLPWDASGVRHPQPRKRYPSFHLYLKYNNQRILLARWRTTIGGWRAEQASDGYEYFRYKGSDIGPRVIRNVVAGPVWIAPESTPIRSLLKMKDVGGAWQRVVNYDELGPGYLSAYGLVAGYFVQPGKNGKPDWDNGIRAHGSSDYLSIYSSEGYSHGCHRLPNHLAIRLYSFILRHRPMRVLGDQGMGFARQFLASDDVFEIRLPSRGYLLPARTAAAGGRARGRHQGHAQDAGADLRAQTRNQVSGPAARGSQFRGRPGRAREPRKNRRVKNEIPRDIAKTTRAGVRASTNRICRRRGWRGAGLSASGGARAPAKCPRNEDSIDPTGPAAKPDTVHIYHPDRSAAQSPVKWGRKTSGLIPAPRPLVVERPRDSGPLDMVIRASGFLPVHTRAYTFSDSRVSVKLTPPDGKEQAVRLPRGSPRPTPTAARSPLKPQ